MIDGKGVINNDIWIGVIRDDKHKRPSLVVVFAGEHDHYKVATFDSDKHADWFMGVAREFFEGVVNEHTD